jgi:hypothetical protein
MRLFSYRDADRVEYHAVPAGMPTGLSLFVRPEFGHLRRF